MLAKVRKLLLSARCAHKNKQANKNMAGELSKSFFSLSKESLRHICLKIVHSLYQSILVSQMFDMEVLWDIIFLYFTDDFNESELG